MSLPRLSSAISRTGSRVLECHRRPARLAAFGRMMRDVILNRVDRTSVKIPRTALVGAGPRRVGYR